MNGLPSATELAKRIKLAANSGQITERRMRRWVAAIALVELFTLAREMRIVPGFLVKGGFALEFRFHGEARASRDVDIVVPIPLDELLDAVVEALRLTWSGFTFRIKGTPARREHSFIFEVNTLYREREWSTFEVEFAFGSVAGVELVDPIDISSFGLREPGRIPCMSVAEQVAQKLHAVSDPSEERPRDLVDIYLLVHRLRPDLDEVRRYCLQVFEARGTHEWPPNIVLRNGWREQLVQILQPFGDSISVENVFVSVQTFVTRLLGLDEPMSNRSIRLRE